MKLYLAGKMSGVEQLNFPAFHAEAARLRALGYEIVNPAELNEGNQGNWQACMKVDIHELIECHGIALLDGWETSEGASLERDIAFRLGLALYRSRSLRTPIKAPADPIVSTGIRFDGDTRIEPILQATRIWMTMPSGEEHLLYSAPSIQDGLLTA